MEPMAMPISASVAEITGPTAAMADPPQIAVPDAIRAEVFVPIPKRRPIQNPAARVAAMVTIAKRAPLSPARNTFSRSIPKPSKTTHP